MAKSDYIKIDIQALNESISSLENEIASAKDNLKKMNTEIAALNSTWQGEGKAVFMKQYSEDYQLMVDALDAMESIKSDLEYVRDAYNHNEIRVETLIGDIV